MTTPAPQHGNMYATESQHGSSRLRFFLIATLFFAIPTAAIARDWKKDFRELERKPKTQATAKLMAVCCNNIGLEQMQTKNWNNAEHWLKKAISLDRDPMYQEHLGNLYLRQAFELYQSRSSKNVGGQMHQRAKLLLNRSLAYNKKSASAYLLLGRIEYDNQKLSDAKRALQSAKRIDPNSQNIDALLAKIERESKVERKFRKSSNTFFEVRYQDEVDTETAAGLKFAMETARTVVGRDFKYHPKHKLILLVYSSKSFSKLNLGPHWAAGLYDGKIRLPLDGKSNLTQAVTTLFHEYTHAVIHDLSQGYCPKWLNEGLADVQGSKVQPRGFSLLKQASKRNQFIPLDDLGHAFQSPHDATVSMAYQQSYSVATFMTKKYGYKRIRRLIDETGKDVPFEIALRKTCGVSTEQLQAKWEAWLPTSWAK